MVEIKIVYKDSNFVSITLKGHADKLVCAGISSIFTGTMNAIEYDNYEISMVEGDSYCRSKKEISSKDKIILETMIIQLKTIQESYPKEIKIIKEN